MIEGYRQYNYKNGILNVLKAPGDEAYRRDVIDALMNDPKFKIELSAEEKEQRSPCGDNEFKKSCRAAVQQLRKEGYIEEVKPNKRGI